MVTEHTGPSRGEQRLRVWANPSPLESMAFPEANPERPRRQLWRTVGRLESDAPILRGYGNKRG